MCKVSIGRLLSVALLTCGLAVSSNVHATGVKATHETSKSHSEAQQIWAESSTWSGAGPSSQLVADSPDLTGGWMLDAADIGAGFLMFGYLSMDDAMNPVTEITQDEVTSFSTQLTRSETGLPPVLGVTLDSQLLLGANDFRLELAAPVFMQLTFSHFKTTSDPGLYTAVYTGLRPATNWLVTDPGFSSTPILLTGDGPEEMELELLTTVPEPHTLVLAGAGVLFLWTVRKQCSSQSGEALGRSNASY